ncbi:phospholipase A1 EG1, chloroplastic/mitochondrial-like [Lolium perenne]|uniref:phospholipase A1 EG1, chloroplastic/mitochondrial-like n=1 Tax=Lolium perenne TaxID=4522 RepID=UPI0021EADF88|nr:phospholipase A1 EG1, chloroplastic/mitochondrial-like [Lolium perenne]
MAFATAATTAAAMALTPQCAKLPGATRQSRTRSAICRAAATATAPGSASTSAPVAVAALNARRGARRTASSVAGMWRQVQGCDDWEGLLDHPVLRSEVARYGELVDACYKAFDLDPASRRHHNCKYGKERMLEEVGMAGAGYEVTKYIYAAPDVITVPTMEASTSGRGRWIGYVAVSTPEMTRRLGRRDVLVSFRGTVTPAEWLANLMSSLEPARLDPCDPRPDVKVESGFLSLYTSADKTCRFGGAGSCREQLLREVSRLIDSGDSRSSDTSVTLAGHSMGGALATLLAYDLAELGLNRAAPITVFSFGGPRVGNAAFKARCDELGVKALRVANVRDPITRMPGFFLNEATTGAAMLRPWAGSCYTHVGVELPLDDLSSVADLTTVHDLGTYIALLRKPKAAARADDGGGGGAVIGRVLDFVGRRGAGAMPWQDAALQMGGLVQTLGLI